MTEQTPTAGGQQQQQQQEQQQQQQQAMDEHEWEAQKAAQPRRP
jgi:hypothetical protein